MMVITDDGKVVNRYGPAAGLGAPYDTCQVCAIYAEVCFYQQGKWPPAFWGNRLAEGHEQSDHHHAAVRWRDDAWTRPGGPELRLKLLREIAEERERDELRRSLHEWPARHRDAAEVIWAQHWDELPPEKQGEIAADGRKITDDWRREQLARAGVNVDRSTVVKRRADEATRRAKL